MPLNFDRAYEKMDKYGLDALVASTSENVVYVGDHWSLNQWMLKYVPVYVVLPRDGHAAIVSTIGDLDVVADTQPWIKEIRCYGTFYIEPPETEDLTEAEERLYSLIRGTKVEANHIEALVKTLEEKGLHDKTLGIDERGITHPTWEELKARLPRAQLKEAYSILREIRMVKTEKEVELLKKAANISERAVEAAFNIVREGVSELDLQKEFEIILAREGAKPIPSVFHCGHHSAFNSVNTDYQIKRGDIVRFDGGCIYQNYYSDIARVAVLGQTTEKQRKYYAALVEGLEVAAEAAKPGVKASEIFKVAVEAVKKSGIPHYRRHHVGHGIGIECYDVPLLGPVDNTPLEEGIVFDIETPYYEFGFGGLQIEETLVVTGDGCEYLTKHVPELRIL
ncbi:MAG: M24 family metallopeptidase [Nitrososphaeria archaeon]|nr:M24 family metallopeptidase [Nitrososphaeria archaeon]NIQ34301.1 M24 family metallopeptidase [Nitrososphaeria archaeon]